MSTTAPLRGPGDILPATARRFRDKTALITAERTLTYAELDDLTARAAAGLRAAGVEPGQVVSLYGPNSWQWVVAYHAVLRAGAVVNRASQGRHAVTAGGAVQLRAHRHHARPLRAGRGGHGAARAARLRQRRYQRDLPGRRHRSADAALLARRGAGPEIALDGSTGEIFTGALAQATPADSNGDLDELLRAAAAASQTEVFARVTLPADVQPARRTGVSGLVTAVDDVLAATGPLDGIVAALLAGGEVSAASVATVEEAIAAAFAPLLAAADGLELGVRAIDFIADETREMLHQTALIGRHPELSVPLGSPALIEAQLAGLTRAELDAGRPGQVHFTVRHLSDPSEAAELRAVGARVAQRLGRAVRLGGYLASPRGVFNFASLAEASDAIWIEVRVLQAAAFGIPARLLLDRQPLDDYVRRGMLSVDPRVSVDPSVRQLLTSVAAAADAQPGCHTGLRLSGPVTEPLVAELHALGFRRFSVEAHEARPAALALGQAVLAAT